VPRASALLEHSFTWSIVPAIVGVGVGIWIEIGLDARWTDAICSAGVP
jgi:hypothetical protein